MGKKLSWCLSFVATILFLFYETQCVTVLSSSQLQTCVQDGSVSTPEFADKFLHQLAGNNKGRLLTMMSYIIASPGHL